MANNVHQQKIAELKEQQAIIKRHQAEESTWMFQLQNVMKDRHQVLMGLLKEQEIEAEQARQALLKYIEEMKSKLDSIRLSVGKFPSFPCKVFNVIFFFVFSPQQRRNQDSARWRPKLGLLKSRCWIAAASSLFGKNCTAEVDANILCLFIGRAS